jgi:hypothetical protein
VQDVQRQTKLGIATSMSVHLGQINDILIRDKELARDFGYKKSELLALLYLDNLEMRFRARKEGVTDAIASQADKVFTTNIMKKEIVRNVWQQFKGEYHPEFVRFLDQVIQDVTLKRPVEPGKDGA